MGDDQDQRPLSLAAAPSPSPVSGRGEQIGTRSNNSIKPPLPLAGEGWGEGLVILIWG